MKYHLIKRCPDGRLVTIVLADMLALVDHLKAMLRNTPDYQVVAVIGIEEVQP